MELTERSRARVTESVASEVDTPALLVDCAEIARQHRRIVGALPAGTTIRFAT